MYLCSDGHDEIAYDHSCPACELIRTMQKCPTCMVSKIMSESDYEKEIERLDLVIFDLNTKLEIERNRTKSLT